MPDSEGATGSVNPGVQQVRERVARLARQIEELSQSSAPENIFFPEVLKRIISAIGAVAGIVWLNRNGQMAMAYEAGLDQTGLRDVAGGERIHAALMSEVVSSGQALSFAGDDKPTPTPHLYILAPIHLGKEIVGVVEILQRENTNPAARPGFLQFVEQMAGYASRYMKLREESREQLPADVLFNEFHRFAVDLARGQSILEVAATAANDGRRLIRCDRVGVAVCRGKSVKIRAISGQDSVNRHANMVRLLERLTRLVVRTGETLQYTGQLQDYPPAIEKALADYVHEGGSRCVLIVPLFNTERLVPRDPKQEPTPRLQKRPRPVGALIVELVVDSRPKKDMLERIERVAECTAAALAVAIRYDSLFMVPVLRALGDLGEQFRGRKLLRTTAILAGVAAVTVALIFTPKGYWVEAKGRLMPSGRMQVFATWDGTVTEILVESGSQVKKGDPVVVLRNDELRSKLASARSQLKEQEQLRAALQAELSATQRTGTQAEVNRLRGKIAQAAIQIKAAQELIEILQGEVDQLTVRAPTDGVVATFQVKQLLQDRPVHRGEALLEIMNPRQPWRLELDLPEYRLGHVIRAQEELDQHELPIDFVLATHSDSTYRATLESLSTRAVVSETEGAVVEVHAAIDEQTAERLGDQLRFGAEVKAKIHCGTKSLAYFLFGDIKEFIQTRFWY